MPQVDLIKPGVGGDLVKTASTLTQASELMKSANQFISTLDSIIGKFRGGGGQDQVLTNPGFEAKINKISTPQGDTQPAPVKSPPAGVDLDKYFTTPEGLKKIAEAIDKVVPIIGDVKLSEVKIALNTALGVEEKKEVKDNGGKPGSNNKDNSNSKTKKSDDKT